jgi:serine/threonine protein phosphatase PrpC
MARIHEGISILICSDGLYNYLSDRELHECLSPSEEKDPLLLEHLLAIAIERGGEDNITAVLVDFG